ncbi:Protein of unknown function [Kordiimonas lacus]|uniref:DUF2891 domain-containing protein n=1 Tax=Kordiimonas lacus TaxID=637679 RepID=A0A1G6XY24_9PROT|nr:DUF2891 domain-containing protein [Kordiimonas lacus]SDD83069.1 Protein of unknown function [Kordiimonas lacus]
MKKSVVTFALAAGLALAACDSGNNQGTATEDRTLPAPRDGVVTDRFAHMALSCIHRQYPNKISHVLNSDADVGAPRELTPAFYGCFDWHSSVHGHWLLVRLMKLDPDSPFADIAEDALAESFTPENIKAEVAYYTAEGRKSFERPYGIAWFLQLVAELEESTHPVHQQWRETLRPLEEAIVTKMTDWLPKLAYPVRLGTHNQSAFAFGLMLDYARTVGDGAFEALLAERTLDFFEGDTSCPIGYEPSGEDFLSPCLMEADLMRRVIGEADFAVWLGRFLPRIPRNGKAGWLEPAIVKDATDGKLVHLDGVNLSRAWALEGIASALPEGDPRRTAILAAAAVHKDAGVKAVNDEHYAGSHWLASFATYLETKRGIM